MCIFSQANISVSATKIFARMAAPGVQAIAYEMNLTTARAVAMVLPVPIAAGAGDRAMTFINLEREPDMFAELAGLFHDPRGRGTRLGLQTLSLDVHEVGSFVASYVPTPADFGRLDPQFRVPTALFAAVPAYADYGFAVFQLAPSATTVHPMAFTFPTRAPDALFFPTVHVHDGEFHDLALFDHELYFQHPGVAPDWQGDGDRVSFVDCKRDFNGVASPRSRVARRDLTGMLANRDTWIATAQLARSSEM